MLGVRVRVRVGVGVRVGRWGSGLRAWLHSRRSCEGSDCAIHVYRVWLQGFIIEGGCKAAMINKWKRNGK